MAKPPPKKTAPKKTSTSTKKRSTKTASARPKAKATKRSTKSSPRAPRTPVMAKGSGKTTSVKQWLMWEAATWGTAAVVGLSIAGGVLWSRARTDVQAYLDNPPTTVPGIVYSAPMELRVGQRATPTQLVGDLLAAGYDNVDSVTATGEVGQFAAHGNTIDIWTRPDDRLDLDGGRLKVELGRGRIAQLSTGATATLRPTVLATLGDADTQRKSLSLDHVSDWVEPALLSMEDSRFREHHGVDPFGIARAVVHNLMGNGGMHGGSTLTQQLAKNLFLSPERTLQRKVREAFFAAALEAELSKDQLLELYLSEVYLGQHGGIPLHGVDQAARAWFGVSAKQLTLAQAATVVGVISAPNAYSPTRHPDRALERRNVVLDRMATAGKIDQKAADTAKQQPLRIQGMLPGAVRRSPWAVDMAVDQAEAALGEGVVANQGVRLQTSIQPLLQRAAEEAVALGMAELDEEYPKAAGAQAALVAVRVSDGAVVAMVGSRDYRDSPFNRAANAWRQAGSTVKPLTLLAAMDEDPKLTPLTELVDEPIARQVDGTTWTPKNYDGRFVGEITIREAIEASRNIPAVKLAETVGYGSLADYYREAGLSRATNLPSASLGGFATTPLELAGAYTAFPGGGNRTEPWVLDRMAKADGSTLLALDHDRSALATNRAAALATHILKGVITDGTGARAKNYGVEGEVGGKTGTTSEYRDAWFVGFTGEYAVAVWVGQDKGTLGLSGSRAALPTWARFVEATGTMATPLPTPSSIEEATVCAGTFNVPRANCPCDASYMERFPKGEVPKKSCEGGSPVVRAIGGLLGRKNKLDE